MTCPSVKKIGQSEDRILAVDSQNVSSAGNFTKESTQSYLN